MTPVGRDTVELRLTGASEPGLFVDEDCLGDLVLRTVHRSVSLGPGAQPNLVAITTCPWNGARASPTSSSFVSGP